MFDADKLNEVDKPISEKAIRFAKERKLKRQNDMTNQEKSQNIAEEYRAVLVANTDFDVNDLDIAEEDVTRLTLDMANWKDAQFKKFLENKKKPLMEAYRSIEQDKDKGGTIWCNPIILIDEIISELFNNK